MIFFSVYVYKHLFSIFRAEKREVGKTGRRSKLGGRRDKKSGAALASLTEGKLGDKKSRKMYAARMKESEDGKKKKGGGKKGKSAFGGSLGRKSNISGGARSKAKRRR